MEQTAFGYFLGQGWSREQAAGIVGNLYGESKLNPNAIGDNGLAYGIAQWHPDRQATFQQMFNVPIHNSTFGQQLQFVQWELMNTESAAGEKLRNATTVYDATKSVMQNYERPKNLSSLGSRIAAATGLLDDAKGLVKKGKSLVGGILGNAITGGVEAAIPGSGIVLGALGIGGAQESWFDALKKWILESGFFQRLALAIVAFIILFAAFYLMKDNIINTVKEKLT